MTAAIEEALQQAKQPAALEKARSLFNFAREQGGGIAEFEVTLSHEEAFDLVQWVRDFSGMVAPEGMPQLEADMAIARKTNDPWVVLQNFTFYGLKTAPLRTRS